MKINFNAGPAALPDEVLQAASKAVLEYEDTGMSVLSIPHRGGHFKAILDEANAFVLQLLSLDDTYTVLWMQGGGRLQFELVPMNFLSKEKTAAYIDSGHWAADALKAAKRYGNVAVVGSSKENHYRRIPDVTAIPKDAAYLHLTANNTIFGTQFFDFPETDIPLIADFSSELFSRNLDYSQFSMLYAVAQKNIGPAGVTLVVIKKKLLQNANENLPEILSYKAMAQHNSIVNTPPVFAIYTSMLYLRWMAKKGLDTIENESAQKAKLLYDYIDKNEFYIGVADAESRSRMNVCFNLANPLLTNELIAFAEEHNITGIAGHRSIGGIRVSLYNATTIADVETLIAVLELFEIAHS